MAISNEVNEFLESVSKSISKETAEVLTTVIGKEVEITKDKISELDIEGIKSLYPSEILIVKFNISKSADDLVYVLFEKDIAVKISSWMLMESEEGVEFSDEHLDSIRETANQILGHLSSVLTEELGKKLEFFSIRAEKGNVDSDLNDIPNPVVVEYTLKMGEDEGKKVTKILSADTVDRFLKGEEAQPEEAAEETAQEGEEKIAQEGEEETAQEGEEEAVTEGGADGESLADEIEEAAEEGEADTDLEESFPSQQEEFSMREAAPEIEISLPEGVSDRINVLMDLSLPVTIELGRTRMLIKDILELGHGSVIEFDRLAGEPVDILINEKKVAEGEVVVIDEHFGIRLTNLIKPQERIKQLGR